MPKVLTVNVPTDGVIVIARKSRRFVDRDQLDMWGGARGYRERWISAMAELIRTMPRPVAMSTARIAAGKMSMAAPAHRNWYGKAMQAAGLVNTGRVQKSPIKSRRGGTEALWA